MRQPPSNPATRAAINPTRYEIVIIGAGFGGIGMAIRLKRAGWHDFVVIEKADKVGGTWRDNTYPGCACDIPSLLYSLSFAPSTSWSRRYPARVRSMNIWRHVSIGSDCYRICASG
jgi:cation diffusion facilitator CzcD-associated flavoprotein CzcO